MKRFLHILLLLVATAIVTVAAFAFSSCSFSSAPGGKFIYQLNSDQESYKVFYEWDHTTYEIDEIKIPDTHKGKPVTMLSRFDSFGMVKINRVVIPASIEIVGVFQEADGLKEVYFEEGSRCRIIHNDAFRGCENLTSVNLPDTVTEIGDSAFSGCALENLSIPKNLTQLGEYAFSGCNFKSFTIPETITSLTGTFSGCTELENIQLPDTLTTIGKFTFSGCTALKSITIPDSVTSLGDHAFAYSAFLTIDIPDSVTSIGPGAFAACNLKSIEIPASVKELSQEAFNYCTILKTVTFAEGSQCETIQRDTFKGCTALKNIQLSEGLTSIAEECFMYCEALTDITIPDSVERIENSVFERCEGLSAIRFGKNSKCTYFGDKAFYKCNNLKSVYIGNIATWLQTTFDGEYTNPIWYADKILTNQNTTHLTIPASVEMIADTALLNCAQLESITFKEGSKCASIGFAAFAGCSSLKSVTFAKNGALKSIGNSAFSGCNNLQSVDFAANELSSIGKRAFSGCAALSSFIMPATVKTVGESAFAGCEGLTNVSTENLAAWSSIEFANEEANPVTYSERLALSGTPITKLEIPQGVTRIGSYAFASCLPVTELTLPQSVKSVGMGAFNGCTQIAKIHLESLAAWCTMQVDEIYATPLGVNANLYIHGLLLTDVVIPDSVKTLREGAFAGYSALETVDLAKVTSVGANAFAGCTALTQVYIPTTVTKIGENAFAGCVNLTIYAQALLAPNGKAHEGWHDNWNPLNRPVKWGQLFMP